MNRALTMGAAAFLLGALTVSAQESYEVLQIVTLPQVLYVGDRVEARVHIRYTGAGRLSPPDDLPQPEWADIHEMRIYPVEGGYDIRILFTPFHTGTQIFPPLNVGPLTLTTINVRVTSILEQNSELATLQGPVRLPFFRLLLLLAILTVALLLLLLLLVHHWGRNHISALARRLRYSLPYLHIRRTLKRLRAKGAEIDGRHFYILLMDDFRRYLSQRMDIDCMAATTREIAEHLKMLETTQEHTNEMVGLFRYSDLVKFARHSATVAMRRRHLDVMHDFIIDLEKGSTIQKEEHYLGVR